MEFGHIDINCLVLVCFRNMVWLGILLMHRLALECKETIGLSRHHEFLYTVSCPKINRRKFFFRFGGHRYRDCIFFKPYCKYLAEYKRLAFGEKREYQAIMK
jgi:hypothetical protein